MAATASTRSVPREIVVAFAPGTTDTTARGAIEATGGGVQPGQEIALLLEACRPYLTVPPVYHARFASDEQATRALDDLAERADVEWTQRNHIAEGDPAQGTAAANPSSGGPAGDPYFPNQWALENVGQPNPWNQGTEFFPGQPDADIDWPPSTNGGQGRVIAVVDSGVGFHPDLRTWVNRGETAGNGIDDDGNGWVDDAHGWDVVRDLPEPVADGFHGNGVAGVAGAIAGNGIGIAGVAPGAEIMSIRLLGGPEPLLDATTLNVAEAFAYAIRNRADAMNNSWGFPAPGPAGDPLIHLATECADRAGTVVVWSGGNVPVAPTSWPSNYPGLKVLRVGFFGHTAGDGTSQPATVDVLAPGDSVMTSASAGGYRYMGGSSFAAPHVTGTAILIRNRHPSLTAAQIRDAIVRGAEPSPQPPVTTDFKRMIFNPHKPRLNVPGALAIADGLDRGD